VTGGVGGIAVEGPEAPPGPAASQPPLTLPIVPAGGASDAGAGAPMPQPVSAQDAASVAGGDASAPNALPVLAPAPAPPP
jgi:hypothetical protein